MFIYRLSPPRRPTFGVMLLAVHHKGENNTRTTRDHLFIYLKFTSMFTISNSVRLIGRLGQDPEVKTTGTNLKIARFSLATNEYYKNADGEKVENTIWHKLVALGPRAEFAEKYLHKGKEIAIEGRLTNHSYEGKDGVKKYVTEIVLNEVRLFGPVSVSQDQ